jgi:hypothetical protein
MKIHTHTHTHTHTYVALFILYIYILYMCSFIHILICLRKRVLLQPLDKIPRIYRVFTKEVKCFRNTYFGMTVRIYKDMYLVLWRNCQNLCGTLQGQDVCSLCHRASVDAAARLLPLSFKHVCSNRSSCLRKVSLQFVDVSWQKWHVL